MNNLSLALCIYLNINRKGIVTILISTTISKFAEIRTAARYCIRRFPASFERVVCRKLTLIDIWCVGGKA